MIRRWGDKGRGPLQQPLQAGQAAGRAAVDPLPFLLGVGIKHELLTVGQHPLGRQPPLREQEGTAVGAEGCRGPVQQVAVVFRGPQLDPAGLGRPEALRLGAGQGDSHPERKDTVRRPIGEGGRSPPAMAFRPSAASTHPAPHDQPPAGSGAAAPAGPAAAHPAHPPAPDTAGSPGSPPPPAG